MANPVKPVPDGYHTVTPYLIVDDPDAILAFIAQAFGGTTRGRHLDDKGRVMHAEAQVGDSRVMLGGSNAEYPPMQSMLHLYVEDVDSVYRRALAAGGISIREPEDMPYGDRSGGVKDVAGNQWWIATHIADVSTEELSGTSREG